MAYAPRMLPSEAIFRTAFCFPSHLERSGNPLCPSAKAISAALCGDSLYQSLMRTLSVAGFVHLCFLR